MNEIHKYTILILFITFNLLINTYGHFEFNADQIDDFKQLNNNNLSKNIPKPIEALQSSTKINEKFERKKIILRRGCSIIRTLDEISKNATDFKSLLEIHGNVQNLTKNLHGRSL